MFAFVIMVAVATFIPYVAAPAIADAVKPATTTKSVATPPLVPSEVVPASDATAQPLTTAVSSR